MRPAETTFRRLTIGDQGVLASMVDPDDEEAELVRLDQRSEALVRIGALVALDAPPTAYRDAVLTALNAGSTLDDLIGVLYAVAALVGSAKVASAAPKIAFAAGYDVDAALEARDG